MLLWRNDHVSLYVYRAHGNPARHVRSAAGVAIKLNGRAVNRPSIRHINIGVHGPTRRVGRGVITAEAVTWRTSADGRKPAARQTVKAFIRIKIGLGGNPADTVIT